MVYLYNPLIIFQENLPFTIKEFFNQKNFTVFCVKIKEGGCEGCLKENKTKIEQF